MKRLILIFLITPILFASCITVNKKTDIEPSIESEKKERIVFGDYIIVRNKDYVVEADCLRYILKDSYHIYRYKGTSDEITLPQTAPDGLPIIEIGPWAFNECKTLKKVTIPDSYQIIQEWSFQKCNSLEEIYIGAGVHEFSGVEVFAFDNQLSVIEVDPKNPTYKAVNNCLLTKDGEVLIAGCRSSVIPETVSTIGANAFCNIEGLVSVEIPSNVTTIGEFAFWGCSGLLEIQIPETVTVIEHAAFHNCPNLTIYCTISERAVGWVPTWDGRNHGEVTERYPLPMVVWATGE